jgi:hypothetical protein
VSPPPPSRPPASTSSRCRPPTPPRSAACDASGRPSLPRRSTSSSPRCSEPSASMTSRCCRPRPPAPTCSAVELGEVLADGAASAIGEAAHQGVTIEPDLTVATAAVEQHAAATAELLARAVAQSAASHAVSVAATQPDTTAVAASVRDHLETLAGAARDYELAGAVTHAQNAGRFAVMDQGPAGRLYASELNDTSTCEFCAEVDGTEYTSMADMLRDYGAGPLRRLPGRQPLPRTGRQGLRRVIGHGVRAQPAARRARAVRPRLLPDARRRADRCRSTTRSTRTSCWRSTTRALRCATPTTAPAEAGGRRSRRLTGGAGRYTH